MLGGLGLLLGSVGLGMLLLRNTLERRGELALAAALGESLRTGVAVEGLEKASGDTWRVTCENGETLDCGRIVLATAAPVAARLLAPSRPRPFPSRTSTPSSTPA